MILGSIFLRFAVCLLDFVSGHRLLPWFDVLSHSFAFAGDLVMKSEHGLRMQRIRASRQHTRSMFISVCLFFYQASQHHHEPSSTASAYSCVVCSRPLFFSHDVCPPAFVVVVGFVIFSGDSYAHDLRGG